MTWLVFVAGALATYYTARAISQEDGPWGVFARLRARWDRGYLGTGVRCVVCVSAYTGLVFALLACTAGPLDPWLWPLWWFGFAGLSVKIHEFWRPR